MRFHFDDIPEWGPRLTSALEGVVSGSLRKKVERATAQSFEDPFDVVLAGADTVQLIEVTRSWLREQCVIGYHGSRLSEAEIASVRTQGLHALIPWRRRERLETILSRHPRWEAAKAEFGTMLSEIGGGHLGCREGQAHLTLSRGTLLTASNHYLVEGSEFDAAVTVKLLGRDALHLLKEGRLPVLFTVAVPGASALEVSERRSRPGEMSGLVRRILQFWAYWLYDAGLDPGTQRLDLGLIFHEAIPASWIAESSIIDEADLLPFYRR